MISQHLANVTLNGSTPVPAETIALSLDEARAPYGVANLTVPYSGAMADALDPRNGGRIQVTLTQTYQAGAPISDITATWSGKALSLLTTRYLGQTLAGITWDYARPFNAFGFRANDAITANMALRKRQIDHKAATITVEATTDETRLTDYALHTTSPMSPATLTVLGAVQMVLSWTVGATISTTNGAAALAADVAAWNPGVTAWEYLTPILAANNLRLWCGIDQVWRLDKPDEITVPGMTLLDAQVTEASDTISKDEAEWYDGVLITYRWKDASNVDHVAYDAAGVNPVRVLSIAHNAPFPGAGEAANRLRKAKGRGRVYQISTTSNYTPRPSQAVRITLPDAPAQTGYVSAVTWEQPADEMKVQTRGLVDTPESAWAFGAAGKRWADVPTTKKWSNFDWSW